MTVQDGSLIAAGSRPWGNAMRWLVGLFLAAVLSGCATLTPRLPADGDQNLIDTVWPYAQMASNVYHRQLVGGGMSRFDLPSRFVEIEIRDNDETGFAYDLYRERRVGVDQFVFVFRGTENPTTAAAKRNFKIRTSCDWWHGNRPPRPAQYGKMLARVDELVRQHQIANDRLTFVGHSLGGGLAVHASFRYPGSYAYAFNRSPLFWRPKPYPSNVSDDFPYRRIAIEQRFEILKIGRIFGKEPTQFRLPVLCVRGSPIERHSMRPLATCLTRLAASGINQLSIAGEAAESMQNNPLLFRRVPAAETWEGPPTCH